jgi:hypothetical protein
VQEFIRQLEETRENNEKNWMAQLETAYNQELQSAATNIQVIYNFLNNNYFRILLRQLYQFLMIIIYL